VTVLEAIQKSADFLAKRGVESPRLQTELFLAHLLKMPRMNLYLNFERALTPAETDSLREAVVRRSKHEPLQHIIGSMSFCGCEITVNRHALVPRPETELLAEEGWKFLATFKAQPPRALDFGTGTGCIAIALAKKCPDAKITCVDISAEALKLAKENAERNDVAGCINFLQVDAMPLKFSSIGGEGRGEGAAHFFGLDSLNEVQFDLIISNPPYIATAEIATLQPEVRDFDPRMALDGGADGLDFYRMLAACAKAYLKSSGRIMLEFGDGQAEAIRQIFENEKWIVEAVKEDYSQRARILIAKI
jgi:release factor glutamine methyltransferase